MNLHREQWTQGLVMKRFEDHQTSNEKTVEVGPLMLAVSFSPLFARLCCLRLSLFFFFVFLGVLCFVLCFVYFILSGVTSVQHNFVLGKRRSGRGLRYH